MISLTLKDLHLGEARLLRAALDTLPIKGQDAKFVANLQLKIEREIEDAERIMQEQDAKKQQGPPQK